MEYNNEVLLLLHISNNKTWININIVAINQTLNISTSPLMIDIISKPLEI